MMDKELERELRFAVANIELSGLSSDKQLEELIRRVVAEELTVEEALRIRRNSSI